MALLTLANQHQLNVDNVATLAIADTVELMNRLEGQDVPRQAYVLREVLPQVTETYGAAAGLLSTNYYEDVRGESAARSTYTPVAQVATVAETTQAAIGFTIAQITKGIAYSTVIDTLAGSVQRTVVGVDRNTLSYNIAIDPDGTRYQRVPSADSCAFCRTMAAVASPTSDELTHFHNFCRCRSVPLFTGQDPIELPEFELTRKAYKLAELELDRLRKEANYYAIRPASKRPAELAVNTPNKLRLMRQITGWR